MRELAPTEARTMTAEEAARARAAIERRYLSCEDPHPPEALCGLMATKHWTAEGVAQMKRELCDGLTRAECTSALADLWGKSLEKRYPRANIAAVAENCRRHPEWCDTMTRTEILWLKLHNLAVYAEAVGMGVEP